MTDTKYNGYDDTPDHLIVWLDQYISAPGNCEQLKMAFAGNCNPICDSPVKYEDPDFHELMTFIDLKWVHFDEIRSLLAAFTDSEKCIEFMRLISHKRIFFITSDSLGRVAVPQIMQELPTLFHNPKTNKPYPSIYVYCADIAKNMDWMINYVDYIQAFTFDKDLLVRMMRDIGDDYREEGKRLWNESDNNFERAENRLNWAAILYHRYEDMVHVQLKKEFEEIEDYESKMKQYKDGMEDMESNTTRKIE